MIQPSELKKLTEAVMGKKLDERSTPTFASKDWSILFGEDYHDLVDGTPPDETCVELGVYQLKPSVSKIKSKQYVCLMYKDAGDVLLPTVSQVLAHLSSIVEGEIPEEEKQEIKDVLKNHAILESKRSGPKKIVKEDASVKDDASPNDIEKWYQAAPQENKFIDIANSAALDAFEAFSRSTDDIYDIQTRVNELVEALESLIVSYKDALNSAMNYVEADEDDKFDWSIEFDAIIKLFNDNVTYIKKYWQGVPEKSIESITKLKFTPVDIKIKD